MKKEYYKMPKEQFEEYLDNVKKNRNTIHFFADLGEPYFFLADSDISSSLLALNKDSWEFDRIVSGFSAFGLKQLIQSFLISEVQSTNETENIRSTRQDIFYVINNLQKKGDKKIVSITNAYQILTQGGFRVPQSSADVRGIYDQLMQGAIDKESLPDGQYYRRGSVRVVDGLKVIHSGFYPEEKINTAMEEFLQIYNDQNMDVFQRLILSHFLIETIHPYYDGNGRLGRFLITLNMYKQTGSYLAFTVATAINRKKNRYYAALNDAEDRHEFGSLNQFALDIAGILHEGFQQVIQDCQQKLEHISNRNFGEMPLTKSEKKIFDLLAEATELSEAGISIDDIIANGQVSRRTVISTLNRFRDNNMLEETKSSRTTYHKLKQ